MGMSYDEMMRMLREINEKRIPPKIDVPDFLKDLLNGKMGKNGSWADGAR